VGRCGAVIRSLFRRVCRILHSSYSGDGHIFRNNTDLEIWLGWKEDLSSTYTEWNIWNRQGGSTDNLALTLNPQGFQNIHDWRLRIKDSAGGDQGYLEEYVIQIG